ncbi:hypothetical protein TRAPUB_13533, partial [Trametes pubescens]
MSSLFERAVGYLKINYTTQFKMSQFKIQLPTALLCCCTLDVAYIYGFAREDGTPEQLALDNIGLCSVAKGQLISSSVRIAPAVFQPLSAK